MICAPSFDVIVSVRTMCTDSLAAEQLELYIQLGVMCTSDVC